MDYQDALAFLGIGSAHPGGFKGTLELLQSLPVKPNGQVLEIGCGTGRTACLIAKQKKCHVTAVDIRPVMIDKARLRAIKEGVQVDFRVADLLELPFEDGSFDLVFVESVTVFNSVQLALNEYCRVTKSGGLLYDREMCEVRPHPAALKQLIKRVYGAIEVPTFEGWIDAVRQAGYREAGLMKPAYLTAEDYAVVDLPDFHQDISQEAFEPGVQKLIEDNLQFLKQYHSYLGFAVVFARKE